MLRTAVLEIGNPADANAWEAGCSSLGISNAVEPIRASAPALNTVLGFLRANPDWLFFSGHFSALDLFAEGSNTSITFREAEVAVTAHDGQHIVRKGTAEFGLDKQCKLVIWGGCSVCHEGQSGNDSVATLFHLFGPHVLLGFAGTTGAAVTEALLGGGFIKRGHFFENVRGHENDPASLRNAWLRAAITGYRSGSGPLHRGSEEKAPINERLFRAVDPDGQEWFTEGGSIKAGRKIL